MYRLIVVITLMATVEVNASRPRHRKRSGAHRKPYDRPPAEGMENAGKVLDLTSALSNLRIAHRGSQAAVDDDLLKDDEMLAAVWTHRVNEGYHPDCASFHHKLEEPTPLSELLSQYRDFIKPEGIDESTEVKYVGRYYVNLKYFMNTKLGGDGPSGQQQLSVRIWRNSGAYSLALNIARSMCFKREKNAFWSADEDGIIRGVEMVFSEEKGMFMITSLTLISPNDVTIPSGYPINHSNLELMNEIASHSDEKGSAATFKAYSEAADRLLGEAPSQTTMSARRIFDAVLN